jgi:hypothetical protein
MAQVIGLDRLAGEVICRHKMTSILSCSR